MANEVKEDVERAKIDFLVLQTADYEKIASKKVLKELLDNTCDVFIEKKDNDIKVYLTCFGYTTKEYYLKKNKYDEENKVLIPNVIGLEKEEAIAKIKESGLEVSTNMPTSYSSIEENAIIKTEPAVGERVAKGSEVVLYVSLGEERIEIEDYTGKNYLEVKGRLEALGLIVKIERISTENNLSNDQVFDQSIKRGTKVKKGEVITLYVW